MNIEMNGRHPGMMRTGTVITTARTAIPIAIGMTIRTQPPDVTMVSLRPLAIAAERVAGMAESISGYSLKAARSVL